MRFSGYFIGLCMVIIAGSLGAVAYLTLGLSTVESAAIAMTALSLLCKIACNIDPLRGLFASNSDPP